MPPRRSDTVPPPPPSRRPSGRRPSSLAPGRISWRSCPGTAHPRTRSTQASSMPPAPSPAPSSTTGSRAHPRRTGRRDPPCCGSTEDRGRPLSSVSCKRTDRSSSTAPEASCKTHGRGRWRRISSRWRVPRWGRSHTCLHTFPPPCTCSTTTKHFMVWPIRDAAPSAARRTVHPDIVHSTSSRFQQVRECDYNKMSDDQADEGLTS